MENVAGKKKTHTHTHLTCHCHHQNNFLLTGMITSCRRIKVEEGEDPPIQQEGVLWVKPHSEVELDRIWS